MKVNIRKYEQIMVTVVALVLLANYTFTAFFGKDMSADQLSVNRFGLFLAQSIPLSLLYVCYLWINRIAILFYQSGSNFEVTWQRKILKVVWSLVQLILIGYLLGPVCNFVAFYVNPVGVRFSHLALLSNHPQPFQNTFGGITSVLLFVLLYLIYALSREGILAFVSGIKTNRTFKVLIINKAVLAFFISIIFAIILFEFRIVTSYFFYSIYFSLVPPSIFITCINLYWFFPAGGDKAVINKSLIPYFLLYTFGLVLLFSLFLGSLWSISLVLFIWLTQVILVTPLSWVSYKQGKEQIDFMKTAEAEIEKSEQELTRSNADLLFLRSQINPHFLFNTLNTLYGTALVEKSFNTADGIQKLGDMMRFMLHENGQDFIPMEKEIEYLQNYIALQKLRIQPSDNVNIEENIDIEACHHKITPMLLIPLVENAFKHGVNPDEKSWIKIMLTCTPNQIHFRVTNSWFAKSNNDPELNKSGIGLINIEKRLQLIYKDYQFNYKREDAEFSAELIIKP